LKLIPPVTPLLAEAISELEEKELNPQKLDAATANNMTRYFMLLYFNV